MTLKLQWPVMIQTAARALVPRQRRSFNGASMGRLVQDFVSLGTSGDAEIRTNLRILRNRTRQLERDNDYVRSFLREIENNIVGQGIPFEAQVKMQRGGKLNESVNTGIQDSWTDWCKMDSCHTAGKLSFNDIENLLIRSIARDGEVIVRKIYQKFGKSRVPIGLELIEADRLDDNFQGRADNGNEIRMGVELNEWGRPVAYYFYTYHPGDYPFGITRVVAEARRMRVPAEEVIHIFTTERIGQTRGIPWLVSAIMRLRQMQGYEEAEVIAARAAASIMGFIQSPEGEAPPPANPNDPSDPAVQDDQRVTDFEPGTWKYLGPGETVQIPNIQRPGGNFGPFMKMMLRGTAAGLGISYEGISKDYSESNYSSARLSLLSDRDNWRKIQKWFIAHFHQVIYEAWLDFAVLAGELKFADYEISTAKYQNVRWLPRGWAWVDPAKEVAAARDAILGGITSATDVIAQEGKDIRDVYASIANERQMATDLKLIFDTDAGNGIKVSNTLPKPSANEQVKGDETK